jgi:RND superfamily putative drug exporter
MILQPEGGRRVDRLGRWCHRRRRTVVAVWLLVLVVVVGAAQVAGGATSTDFSVPGSESQRAFDLLRERFPSRSGDTADIVVRADAGVAGAEVRSRLESLFSDVGEVEHVIGVASPYASDARRVSADGTIAFATVQFDVQAPDLRDGSTVDDLKALAQDASGDGLQIELGGRVIQFADIEGPGGRGERIGLLVAVLVLLVSFGSVVAMGLPILTALASLGVALSGLSLLANVIDISDFGPRLATLIGLGVGIDYALFIVTRYRQGLHHGLDPENATEVALSTAGRAVVFAGLTVVLSLSGMLLMGVPVVGSLALGTAMTVLVAIAASLTLVPAVLGFIGTNIDRLPLPGRRRDETAHRATGWFRWSRLVQRRPWPFALAGLVVLVALATPALAMRLGSGDAGSDPTTKTARRAYDLLAVGFGPGFNGPLLIVAEGTGVAGGELVRLTEALARVDGVAAVAPPQLNPQGDVAVVTVFPTTAPQDEATLELMNRLRDDVIPAVTASTGMRVSVGGVTAIFEDLGVTLTERLPIFIAAVLGLSFLLLAVVFRSVVIPLKAVVMNLLSIGAAYGVIVAVFQWGWAAGVIGIDRTGPIQSFIPMLLFAVLFGLSMDYEVFLISRIREEYLRVDDNGLAVADGLAATARVITAAAAIMVAVFGSALLAEDRTTKLFGLGLATAIFIDATLVRTVLVPATMELLGRSNWWLPAWLDRLLPRVSVDAEGSLARAVLAEEATAAVDADNPVLVDGG